MADEIPECLEFFLVEIVIQRVPRHLCLVSILNHFIQDVFVKDALNQRMDAIRNFLAALRNRCQDAVGLVSTIFVRYMVVLVNVIVLDEITVDVPSLLL